MTRSGDMKPAVEPSPLQLLITDPKLLSSSTHLPSLQTLAVQVQHDLRYQHSWTDLRVHTHSPLSKEPLPRPLLSGLPPQRLYIHPDEQVALLKKADQQRKAGKENGPHVPLEVKADSEREWILPTRLNEKWTLHRLSDVFGGIGIVPPAAETAATEHDRPANPWRTTKRVILATVDPDSTVVYYIVHDGVVKPRQN